MGTHEVRKHRTIPGTIDCLMAHLVALPKVGRLVCTIRSSASEIQQTRPLQLLLGLAPTPAVTTLANTEMLLLIFPGFQYVFTFHACCSAPI